MRYKVYVLGTKKKVLEDEEFKFGEQLISTLPLVPIIHLNSAWRFILFFFVFLMMIKWKNYAYT